jgi:phosphonate transport system substrate-binding protein
MKKDVNMNRSLTKRSFVALAASASLALAACGSDDADTADTATTEAPAEEEAPVETDAPAEEAPVETEAPAEEAPADTEAPADEVDREGWPDSVIFTLTPSQETGGLIETAQPLADLLAAELGVEVEALVPSDYAGVIVALQSGQAQIAGGLGPSQMVQAADTAGANLILQSVRFGDSQYVTQWFTNNPDEFCDDEPVANEDGLLFCNGVDEATGPGDGPIGADKLSLVAGKTVSFVDQGSTSGYLIPSLGLLDAGVDPLDDIESLFAGGHDFSVQAVYDGDAEVGVSFNDARGGVAETVPDVGETVVVFGWSSPIPNDGFAVSGDLPESLQQAITDAFIAIAATEDGAALLDELYEIDGLVPVPDGSYDIIRSLETELADLLG